MFIKPFLNLIKNKHRPSSLVVFISLFSAYVYIIEQNKHGKDIPVLIVLDMSDYNSEKVIDRRLSNFYIVLFWWKPNGFWDTAFDLFDFKKVNLTFAKISLTLMMEEMSLATSFQKIRNKRVYGLIKVLRLFSYRQ